MKGKLARGAAWIGAARVLSNAISFASILLLARLLTPADFGLVAIATTVVAVVDSVTQLSVGQALVQHHDPDEDHYHSAWTLNLFRAVFLGAIIFALAWPVSHFFSDDRLVPVMCVIAAGTVISGAGNPKMAMFSRELVFWQEFALAASQAVAGFVAAIAIALVWRSYWALIGGLLASQLAGLILSYLFISYRPRLRFAHARELLSFSGWVSLSQIVNTFNWRADHLFIGYFLGKPALGFYSVGDRLALMPTRETTAPIAYTLFPGFSRMANDGPRLRSAYIRAQATMTAIALPAGFGFALIAHPLVQLAMTSKWLPAVIVIQFLAGIFAVQTLALIIQPLAMAMGETRTLFRRDLMMAAFRLPLIVAGMFLAGLPGILYARCISGLTATIYNMALARRLVDLRFSHQLMANWRAMASTAIMIAATYSAGLAFGDAQATASLMAKIALMCVTGIVTYGVATGMLWMAAGRPPGPESEFLSLMSSLTGHMSRRSPATHRDGMNFP